MTVDFIVYLAIVALGFVIGLTFFTKAGNYLSAITIYLGAVLILELSGHFMAVLYKNNMPAFHISLPVYFVLLGLFFYQNMADDRVRKTIPFTIGGLVLFAVVNAIFFQSLNEFPTYVARCTTFIYIVWSAFLFAQYLDEASGENIFKNPVFMATTAILWFNIISMSFFLLYPFMTKYDLPSETVYNIHFFSNCVYYILLLLAIVFAKTNLKNDRTILQ
ncbi:MAG: hypothetical protein EOO03_05750 [Chitinophagaceae bacterium]|nr:MAG: hypothetical protein EOO03_05750 [Chitinophagaceae bacterium]